MIDTVGLDIGHTAIKAVRLRRSFGGRESVTCFQQKFSIDPVESLDDEQKARILKQFVQAHGLLGSKLMTALPCSDLFVRTLMLPFHDAKKLAQVIPCEVESMIPLPLEDVAVDYQRLTRQNPSASAQPGPVSHVLVAAVQKSILTRHVRNLAEAGIDPGAIQVDALALLSLAQHLTQRNGGLPDNLAVIDLGASKTTICLSHQGDPWLVRTIRCGTDDLTNAKAARTVCSLPEADGKDSTGAVSAYREFGGTALVRELRRTLHAYEANTRTRLRSVWFCGGGAALAPLTAELGRCLELEPVGLPQRYHARCAPEYSVAFGLAVMGQSAGMRAPFGAAAIGAGIDLKRVMDATLAELQDRWRQALYIGLSALVIVLLFFADLTVQMVLKHTRVQELKTVLRNDFLAKFPGIDLVTNEADQAKAALSTIRNTTERLGGEELPMVPFLAELIRRLPKGVALKMHTLTVESQAIQMEAETDSFESVEKIKAGLLQFSEATDVAVRDARIGTSPNQVLFRVTISRGPPQARQDAPLPGTRKP